MLNRRTLLKTFGLGALVAAPGTVSDEKGSDRSLDRLHPISVARRVATVQLAHQQKTGAYDRMDRVFGEDAKRVPDDHPLKASFLQGSGFDDYGLDVAFALRDDRSGYWLTVGTSDSTSRFYVNEKNVIYRSTDDSQWNVADLRSLSPEQRLWTPIVRKEFDPKTAKTGGFFGAIASVLNAVVPVVQAQVSHGNCCKTDYPWWWFDCYDTHGIDDCAISSSCNCAGGFYFCVQGFEDCQGCCINCSGNCECSWDRCPGS